ncbi:MAG: hypothetical protein KGL18_07480 [Burkholderiales bacterium]|nr:hypothetical protein [Burkholderiales bacterium]MDE1926073.1 hypothetical protein [Burkholderiales bacterium]MDE2158171.1 hypothetical protein [Burkholderiales bacterium]MDE2502800.1 hypothetical protein [Burkholderiales bacterium]
MAGLDLLPIALPTVAVVVDDPFERQRCAIRVPGSTEEEGYEFLETLAASGSGSGARQWLTGATFEPIREFYRAHDARIAGLAEQRLSELGPQASVEQIREVARWASGKRTAAARLWRVPSGPEAMALGELRDWHQYGLGGRTLPNLMRRNLARTPGLAEVDNLCLVIRSAAKANPRVTLQVGAVARSLRAGGVVLMLAGAGLTAWEYSETARSERPEFLRREGASMAGSAIATGVVTTALVMSFALPGIVVVGLGVVAGVVGAWVGERIYLAARGSPAHEQAMGSGIIHAELLRYGR